MVDRTEIRNGILDALYSFWNDSPFGKFNADKISERVEDELSISVDEDTSRSILGGMDDEHLIDYSPSMGSLGMISYQPGGIEKYNQSNNTFLDEEYYIDILGYLVEEDNQNPQRLVKREDVINNIELSEEEIERNIWYLYKKKQVDLMQAIGSTWVGVQIEQFGRRVFEDYEAPQQQEWEEGTSLTDSKYDVFISHASEDKSLIAKPLAKELQNLGAKVWLDEFELKIGDDLRESIDEGLNQSRYGIVILSDSFFGKNWTEYELEGLTARDMSEDKVILPVWYNIGKEVVMEHSPSLANKLAAQIDEDSIQEVSSEIYDVME